MLSTEEKNKLLHQYGVKHYHRIRDENVVTVSFRKNVNVKDVIGIIRMSKKRSEQKGPLEALFFGENEWEENKPKVSTHWHIAFLNPVVHKLKVEMTRSFEYFASHAAMADKKIVCRWHCNGAVDYLTLGHSLPFYKRF